MSDGKDLQPAMVDRDSSESIETHESVVVDTDIEALEIEVQEAQEVQHVQEVQEANPTEVEIVSAEPVAIDHLIEDVPVVKEIDEEVEAPGEESAQEQPKELSESQLLKQISSLEADIEKIIGEASELDRHMETTGVALEERIRVEEEFSDWITRRRASYTWQLLSRLKRHQGDLALDEKLIKDFSEAAPLIPEGFGESTRKWFMKRFWLNFSISWGIILLLYLVNRYSDEISTWLEDLFDGRSFLKLGLDLFLQQAIGLSLAQVIGLIFGFSLLLFIGHLFGYSRKNSEYLQLVAEENSATNAMEKGIDTVKAARERIDSLHPQVPQILEVLSIGLHKPWEINDESLMFSGLIPDTSKLPSCVEVAIPTITSKSPKYEELVNKTMNEIQIQGWRSQAYTDLMQSLAESIGFGGNNMAVRELEEDQRKTGKRNLIATAAESPEPSRQIGGRLVEHFTRVVQEKVLPLAQPQVVSLRPDPLEGLHLDGSLSAAGNLQVSNWEEKLAEIADLASPWSVSSFSPAGTANNRHQGVESIFIASERVPSREGVAKESSIEPGARPFEVSIRVDLSAWCKPHEVAIFADFKPTAAQVERWSRGGSTHGAVVHIEGQSEPQIEGGEDLVL